MSLHCQRQWRSPPSPAQTTSIGPQAARRTELQATTTPNYKQRSRPRAPAVTLKMSPCWWHGCTCHGLAASSQGKHTGAMLGRASLESQLWPEAPTVALHGSLACFQPTLLRCLVMARRPLPADSQFFSPRLLP